MISTVSVQTLNTLKVKSSVVDPGSAWIRIDLAVLDPDPGAWKWTKINK
jgi:hypothetical protein